MTFISLWNDDEYKKNPEQKNCMQFVGDAPNGGCIVICGFCGKELNSKDLDVCPHCGKDLIYPRCDW